MKKGILKQIKKAWSKIGQGKARWDKLIQRCGQWLGEFSHVPTQRRIVTALMVLSLMVGVFAAAQIITIQSGYEQARQEYADLRQYLPINDGSVSASRPGSVGAAASERGTDGTASADGSSQAGQSDLTAGLEPFAQPSPEITPGPRWEFGPGLSDINADYAGWIQAGGTVIDYPVVLGEDNFAYLRTTFSGETNSAGSIFMDYRCEEGFDSPVVILYGHNMKDGSMFAQLKDYLQDGFRTKNYEIAIIKPDEEQVNYRIFAARITDVYDRAFTLPAREAEAFQNYATALNAPEGGNILVLSTCTSSRDESERLLVFAVQTVA